MKQTSGNQQYQNTKKNIKKLKIGKHAVTDWESPVWLEYFRCEDYAISLLEQCEDLREVEVFLQTKYSGNKDANYILAILGETSKSLNWYWWMNVIRKEKKEIKFRKFQSPFEGCFWLNSRNTIVSWSHFEGEGGIPPPLRPNWMVKIKSFLLRNLS